MTLGSLFDGAGGFPFAAQLCGIEPVWASEIEAFPIAVTTKRFPTMKHLGDITKINGAEIEPVDVITFGSPCQDLSVAGRRAGLEGERSGLFTEAVRIIREMREATNGRYPRYAVWENVPGAFSSNRGGDFRVVLEELCKVKDRNAAIPRPAKGKWSDAGQIVGDGYSLGWRVLDAQYWGVPQRRRRIFLVADFGGGRAGEILFEREGLRRSFAESRESWQGITKSLAFGTGAESRATYCLQGNCIDRADTAGCNGKGWTENVSYTLNTIDRPAVACCIVDSHNGRAVGDVSLTVRANCGSPTGNNVVLCVRERCGCEGGGKGCLVQVDKSGTIATSNDQFLVYALDRAAFNAVCFPVLCRSLCARFDSSPCVDRGQQFVVYAIGNGQDNQLKLSDLPGALNCMHDQQAVFAVDCRNFSIAADVNGTLQAKPNGGSSINLQNVCLIILPRGIIIRRLTPTECARLQGMPDWWCDDVPHSDTAEYKLWGNGMALPCVLYVMEGIEKALKNGRPEHGA